jgi:hypothetical protein
MAICTTCHKLCEGPVVPLHHKCPPAWLVWDPDQSTIEDARTIYAHDADWAVTDWAEQDDNDSAEYSIAKGTATIVHVQLKDGSGDVHKYRVTGEYEPNYHAEYIG